MRQSSLPEEDAFLCLLKQIEREGYTPNIGERAVICRTINGVFNPLGVYFALIGASCGYFGLGMAVRASQRLASSVVGFLYMAELSWSFQERRPCAGFLNDVRSLDGQLREKTGAQHLLGEFSFMDRSLIGEIFDFVTLDKTIRWLLCLTSSCASGPHWLPFVKIKWFDGLPLDPLTIWYWSAFNGMQGKVVSVHGADAQWYEPTQIPQDKYLKIVQGRNLFLVTFITGSAVIWGLSLIPQWCMYRSVSWMYRKYCRGRVLDLTPKVADARDVRYYEMSNAVRVEFIVKERVDDDEYKTDLSLSEEEQTERRRALTLGFMLKNDYNWAGSSITFDTVERRETEMPDFRKYDTVVIRNELLNMGREGARKMLNSAAAYVKEGGYVLLMDFGKPRWPLLASLTRWFGAATRSSMNLTHDYGRWVAEDNCYSIIAERRCLMGVHYAFVLQRKP